MSSGLSRRRVNNTAVGANGDEQGSRPATVSRGPSRGVSGGGGGDASDRDGDEGHKIGYDPNDIGDESASGRAPKLTLMEEVLLLGLKDRQGYLSFWNDNISYALRGCILLELALRGKIQMQRDNARRRFPLPDRLIELVDDSITGEVLLDEAIGMIKTSEPMSVASWIDLLSGETWNLMKIGYQLKQVRERLAKGLVDKGILRTEKRNFLLFDMATHPVADFTAKDEIRRRVISVVSARTLVLPSTPYFSDGIPYRALRTMCLVCAAYAANVLENALTDMGHEARERGFARVFEMLGEYSSWPFVIKPGNGNLGSMIQDEVSDKSQDIRFEVVAAVISVLTRLDSIL